MTERDPVKVTLVRQVKHKDLVPAAMPAQADLLAAWKILDQQTLAIYQRLYREGLTSPGIDGRPFAVRRSQLHGLCIEIVPAGAAEYSFLVAVAHDHEAVVEKAETLMAALNAGKAKVHPLACCPCASIEPCVCRVSFKCLIHGGTCHGTHD